MGKFDGILICSDLDGTLLRDDKSISRENLDAIEAFRAEGGAFTFITGRMPFYVSDTLNALGRDVPFGCINGGGIYDPKEGKYLWTQEPLSPRVLDILDYAEEKMPETGFQINTFERLYFCKQTEAQERFRRVTGVPPLLCHHRKVPAPMAKVIFVDSPEGIDRLAALLAAHPLSAEFDLVRSAPTLFEILGRGINKGTLIPKMAEIFGTTVEKTVAVGDYDNDIGMLRAAGVGVAVANAIPEAKAAADHVTVSNEEHAIAAIIRDIERGVLVV